MLLCSKLVIGFATEAFPIKGTTLGQFPASYGYMDRNLIVVSPGNTKLGTTGRLMKGSTKDTAEYGKPFGVGDTVGAGIAIDSYNQRRIFYTLNGVMLGYTEFFGTIPSGFDAYPTVCMSGGEVQFQTNFDGVKQPWAAAEVIRGLRFNHHNNNYIGSIPAEILKHVLRFSAETQNEAALLLPRVCSQWNQISEDEEIWRPLYFKRWQHQSRNLKVKSWKRFYQLRYVKFPGSQRHNQIEGCSFEFECTPRSLRLASTLLVLTPS